MIVPRLLPIPPQPQPQQGRLGLLAPPAAALPTWQHIRHAELQAASGAIGIVIPVGYAHAWVKWEASDTSANTTASVGGIQIGVNNAALDTGAHYTWVSKVVTNTTAGALSESLEGSPNGGQVGWGGFASTGGGTGSAWRSEGDVWFDFGSRVDSQARARWEYLRIDNNTIHKVTGSGYFTGAQGPITSFQFFGGLAGLVTLAAGSALDLFVAN